MAPSKKRSVLERKANHSQAPLAACPCTRKPRSDGLCALNVWQGTTIDATAARSAKRLLRPQLPVVKYKEWTLFGLSGHLYHLVILSWMQLLALFVALYIFVVGIFALLFAACNGIDIPTRHAEARYYFNLSLQTLATIDSCSNWVSLVEAFCSMLLMSFMTGVAFVKFARPHPSIIFSKVFTVSKRENGVMEMRFRVVNGTRREVISRGEILEVSFKLILMRVEDTKDGEKKLCYYDLRLVTNSFIALRLEAELAHQIDETSPFFGLSQSDIYRSDFVLILMMSGVDQNLHDMIHKQYEYNYATMQWGATFVPMLHWNGKYKSMELDFDKVSTTDSDPAEDFTCLRIDDNSDSSTTTQPPSTDDREMDSLKNVEDSEHEVDLNQLHFETLLSPSHNPRHSQVHESPPPGSPARGESDAESEKSETSTKTNSDPEDIGKYTSHPQYHVRFNHRSRSTAVRIPHLMRHVHSHEYPGGATEVEPPVSLARRHVRFKNHPLSRFSKGLYYRALETSWLRLFLWLVVIYFAVISITALLMYISPGNVIQQTADVHFVTEYERILFFCAQTISTIGYGSLSPNPDSNFVNFFVFVLVFAGTVVSTLLTGLTWAKFSIPKASTVLFSDNLLLTAFHGKRSLIFRAANNRTYGAIIEGSFRVSVVMLNHRLGRRETHELKLVRNVWPIVQLGNTVTHIIDEHSPLYELSTDEILSGHHFFVVLFTGLDSVIGENMFARKTYHSCDILVGHQFVDNIKLAADGLHIDLEAINDTKFTPGIELRESHLYDDASELPHFDEVIEEEGFGASESESHRVMRPIDPEDPLSSPQTKYVVMDSK
ncbi:Inward rectifier potassium channel 4, partial [Globisporangium splendens]